MAGSFLDTLLEIQITKEDVLQHQDFGRAYLSALFPDLDLRDNVALSDLVLRAVSTLAALVDKGIAYHFEARSVASITNESNESDVDITLSNLFMRRLSGSSAIVAARLYFLRGDRDIYISATNTLSADNVVVFRPVVDTAIPSSALTYDNINDQYYYDLDLISDQQVESANIESGDLIYHTQIDPYFVRASVQYLKTKSVPNETNEEFVSRSETAISTRNLINNPSILFNITSTFNYLKQVVPIGMGDAEMKRDLISVIDPFTSSAKTIHVGGCVDIYVNGDVTPSVKQYQTDSSGVILIESETEVILKLRRATLAEASDEGLTDDIPNATIPTITYGAYVYNPLTTSYDFQPVSNDNDYGLSPKQVIKVQFSGVSTPSLASFHMLKVEGVNDLQSYLEDELTRVVSADYLGRVLNTYYLTINLKKVGNVALSAAEIADAYNAVYSFLATLEPGQRLVVTDILDAVKNEGKVSGLDIGISVTYTLLDTLFNHTTGSISSVLDPDRTFRFYLKEVTSV